MQRSRGSGGRTLTCCFWREVYSKLQRRSWKCISHMSRDKLNYAARWKHSGMSTKLPSASCFRSQTRLKSIRQIQSNYSSTNKKSSFCFCLFLSLFLSQIPEKRRKFPGASPRAASRCLQPRQGSDRRGGRKCLTHIDKNSSS